MMGQLAVTPPLTAHMSDLPCLTSAFVVAEPLHRQSIPASGCKELPVRAETNLKSVGSPHLC